ncbi:MAG: arsenic resistance N-acetyltransferase ArsN2 [Myxococcaceae bacterium]
MRLSQAQRSDWPDVKTLLLSRELPVAGAEDHLTEFVVTRDEKGLLIGVAGLEVHAGAGLLRSVAVRADAGSKGLGSLLTRAVVKRARRLGLRNVYLLTTSAAAFFERHGFEPVPRDALPTSLVASRELQDACPASATAMRLGVEQGTEEG